MRDSSFFQFTEDNLYNEKEQENKINPLGCLLSASPALVSDMAEVKLRAPYTLFQLSIRRGPGRSGAREDWPSTRPAATLQPGAFLLSITPSGVAPPVEANEGGTTQGTSQKGVPGTETQHF